MFKFHLIHRLILLALVMSTLPTSCARTAAGQFAPFEKQATANLRVSEKGLDNLRQLLEQTKSRAAVVLFRGEIIAEWYWQGTKPETVFETWSVSKSFASTCIGLLMNEGKIGSVQDPVSKYVPEWSRGQKSQVRIENILLQNSGLKESGRFLRERNQLAATLGADIVTTPGAVTRYNNAACNVLSAVIRSAASEDPEVYMRKKVWKPIGMTQTRWWRDGAGNVITYAGIQITARDLAKFGQLFLNNGKWGRKQIISEEWINKSTTPQTTMQIANFQVGPYGYLWWLDQAKQRAPHNYSALGFFGNNLTVIPELDLVAVRLVGSDAAGMPLMMMIPRWVEAVAGVVEKQ